MRIATTKFCYCKSSVGNDEEKAMTGLLDESKGNILVVHLNFSLPHFLFEY